MAIVEQNAFGISEALIQQARERIVHKYHPHKIVLFGSFAWGEPKEYSDLDLLIIMDSAVARPDERAIHVHRLLHDLHCPMDLLVYTPEEISRCLKRGNLFIAEILEKGRLLYAR
jgi:predicted nucleotidyltransferase